MSSPIGAQGTLTIQSDDNGSSIHIHICEQAGIQAENLSLSTWGASFILANQLHKLSTRRDQKGTSVLELGAGTGLVGLSAAALWGADVILTDLPSIVPALAANIALNAPLIRQNNGAAVCGSLDWTKPTAIHLPPAAGSKTPPRTIHPQPENKPSAILAADVIYDEDHPELLSKTILTWLAPSQKSMVILCYPLRMAYIDHIRKFWELMEDGGLECVEEGKEEGEEEWNEVANTPYEWCVWRWKEARTEGAGGD